MSQDKLTLAAQAAGYAMVNPDEALSAAQYRLGADHNFTAQSRARRMARHTVRTRSPISASAHNWFDVFSRRVGG